MKEFFSNRLISILIIFSLNLANFCTLASELDSCLKPLDKKSVKVVHLLLDLGKYSVEEKLAYNLSNKGLTPTTGFGHQRAVYFILDDLTDLKSLHREGEKPPVIMVFNLSLVEEMDNYLTLGWNDGEVNGTTVYSIDKRNYCQRLSELANHNKKHEIVVPSAISFLHLEEIIVPDEIQLDESYIFPEKIILKRY